VLQMDPNLLEEEFSEDRAESEPRSLEIDVLRELEPSDPHAMSMTPASRLVEDFTLALSDRQALPAKGEIFVMRAPTLRPQHDVESLFAELADRWEAETLVLASPVEAAMHSAYQRIIGLGLQVITFILERLQQTRRYWFWALAAITGENPAAGAGSTRAAVDAWVDWGRERGYLGIA
jgi:hypothetical protein